MLVSIASRRVLAPSTAKVAKQLQRLQQGKRWKTIKTSKSRFPLATQWLLKREQQPVPMTPDGFRYRPSMETIMKDKKMMRQLEDISRLNKEMREGLENPPTDRPRRGYTPPVDKAKKRNAARAKAARQAASPYSIKHTVAIRRLIQYTANMIGQTKGRLEKVTRFVRRQMKELRKLRAQRWRQEEERLGFCSPGSINSLKDILRQQSWVPPSPGETDPSEDSLDTSLSTEDRPKKSSKKRRETAEVAHTHAQGAEESSEMIREVTAMVLEVHAGVLMQKNYGQLIDRLESEGKSTFGILAPQYVTSEVEKYYQANECMTRWARVWSTHGVLCAVYKPKDYLPRKTLIPILRIPDEPKWAHFQRPRQLAVQAEIIKIELAVEKMVRVIKTHTYTLYRKVVVGQHELRNRYRPPEEWVYYTLVPPLYPYEKPPGDGRYDMNRWSIEEGGEEGAQDGESDLSQVEEWEEEEDDPPLINWEQTEVVYPQKPKWPTVDHLKAITGRPRGKKQW